MSFYYFFANILKNVLLPLLKNKKIYLPKRKFSFTKKK